VSAPRDLLDRVVRLSELDDHGVAEFARSYGLLIICDQHRLPLGHSRVIGWDDEPSACEPLGADEPYVPTDTYRQVGRQVRAALNLAADLHQARPDDWDNRTFDADPWRDESRPRELRGDSADWAEVCSSVPRWHDATLFDERQALGAFIDLWLDLADARLTFAWDDEIDFGVKASGLFRATAVGLALTVARSEGLARCRGCGRPYAPSRRPSSTRRNYCAECGKRGRWRDAQRARRERDATKRKRGREK